MERAAERNLDAPDLAVGQIEGADATAPVDAPDKQLVRHRCRDHHCLVFRRQGAEVGNRSAPAPVPVEVDLVDVNNKRISRLRALDVERPGLRIDLAQIELRKERLVTR